MRKGLLLSIIALLILAGLLTDVVAQEDLPATNAEMAYVRLLHLARDFGDVNIYLDGESFEAEAEALVYLNHTNWLAVPAGTHTLSLVEAGGDLSKTLLEETFSVTTEEFSTVVILNSQIGDGALQIAAVRENFDEMLPGTARVTFLNALSDASVVNFNLDGVVYVTSLGALGIADDSRDAFVSIPMDAGTYDFSINITGETNVLSELPDTPLRDDEVYALVAVGTADEPTLLLYVTTAAQAALVRGNLQEPGTLVEAVQAHDILLPFYDLLVRAESENILKADGPYTVFAPADFVLENFSEGFDADMVILQNIIGNHVVPGDYKFSELAAMGEGATLTTVTGQTLVIGLSEDALTINDAPILVENIPAVNGTIHVIGELLVFEGTAIKDNPFEGLDDTVEPVVTEEPGGDATTAPTATATLDAEPTEALTEEPTAEPTQQPTVESTEDPTRPGPTPTITPSPTQSGQDQG